MPHARALRAAALLLAAAAAVVPCAVCTMTPEPQADPFVPAPPAAARGPRTRLMVVPAGRAGSRMGRARGLSTRRRNSVCMGRFPAGLSVRCAVRGMPREVVFKVDGEWARTERERPYYVAGDWGGEIYAWRPRKKMVRVRCEPEGGKAIEAVIVFRCGKW